MLCLTWEGGTPIPSWEGGYPLSGRMGYSPSARSGIPPVLTWEGGTTPSLPGKGVPPVSKYGVPPLKCEETHTCGNSTFPHTSYAGGNQKTRMLISIVSCFICRCLSSLFKELWPFENSKMYRNVLKIHF